MSVISSSAEMRKRVILNPSRYPLILLRPNITSRRIRYLGRYLHVFDSEFKCKKYSSIVSNHFKKSIKALKGSGRVEVPITRSDTSIFDKIVNFDDAYLMLFSHDTSERTKRSNENLFIRESTTFDDEIREGLICNFHTGVPIVTPHDIGHGFEGAVIDQSFDF